MGLLWEGAFAAVAKTLAIAGFDSQMKEIPMKLRHVLTVLVIGLALTPMGASRAQQQTRSRPNILLAIADDWSFGHAGVYGCNWVKTPAFDRVAREGVLFTNAFTSNPKCSPSRASMLTGRNTWQLKEAVNHISIFPNDFAVYPDLLEKAGYWVGYAGKGWAPGNYKVTGFEHNPAGHEYVKYKLKPPHKGISPKDYARNFEDFIEHRPEGKPFCFWYGGHEPHRAYEDGAGIAEGKNLKDVDVPAYLPDNATIRSDLLDYAVEVDRRAGQHFHSGHLRPWDAFPAGQGTDLRGRFSPAAGRAVGSAHQGRPGDRRFH